VDCPYPSSPTYTELAGLLHKRAWAQRLPISGSLELTARCNLACRHCYIRQPALSTLAGDSELGTEEWYRVLDQAAEAGCLWLMITGGEPLIRKDFFNIYEHAKRLGMLVTIFTNATLLTEKAADRLAALPPYSIEVSLYGHDAATYERVTGVSGSFELVSRGIRLICERGLSLRLKTPVMTLNCEALAEIRDFAGRLGVPFRFDAQLNRRIDGNRGPEDLRLTAEQTVALDIADEKRFKAMRDFCAQWVPVKSRTDTIYICGAGVVNFHVTAGGGLTPCLLVRQEVCRLLDTTFEEGWNRRVAAVLSTPWTRESRCRTCPLLALCGQCPGWAQLENDDPEAPVIYLCEIAHERARVFNLEYSIDRREKEV